jgi:hypothetical protein
MSKIAALYSLARSGGALISKRLRIPGIDSPYTRMLRGVFGSAQPDRKQQGLQGHY